MAVFDLIMEQRNLASTTLLDARWTVVEGIIAGRNFAKSGRLSAFLIYIVRCTIENRQEEITEQQIGVHVFGRSPGYNPSEDNIVRTTARQLRQRLALYYQEEGSDDEIRVEVPRGGYIPVFLSGEKRSSDLEFKAVDSLPVPQESSIGSAHLVDMSTLPRRIRHSIPRTWLYATAFLCLGAALTLLIETGISAVRLRASATDDVWRTLFSSRQTTIFVPGDAGLNMHNNEARAARQVSLADYIGGKYIYSSSAQSTQLVGAPLAARRYVNIADLQLADRIAALKRVHRDNYQIRFPRDMAPDDFRNVNVILSGAPVYNPWDELFDGRLNFHFVYNNTDGKNMMYIVNRKPLTGEPPIYATDWKKIFGYIALTDNLDNNGKVLLIEGTSHVGVEAAVDFLFNDKKMAPILARAKRRRGELDNFEVLLDAAAPNNSGSGHAEVLATRFY